MRLMNRHSKWTFLVWTLALQLLLCWSGVYTSDSTKKCKLYSDSESERKVLKRLEPLAHRNFTVESINGTESYTYVFQLCGDAWGVPGAGLVQLDHETKTPKTIGSYSATQAYGGSDWVFLIYRDGEAYDAHCSKEKRKAMIMFSCNRNMGMVKHLTCQVFRKKNRQGGSFYQYFLQNFSVPEK